LLNHQIIYCNSIEWMYWHKQQTFIRGVKI